MKISEFMDKRNKVRPIRYRAERRMLAKVVYRAMKRAGRQKESVT